jgi:tetratricopeptide (TPR) repeat protein
MLTDLFQPRNNGSELPHSKRFDRFAGFAGTVTLFSLTLLVYWPAIQGKFVWDDWLIIQKNPLLTGEFRLHSIWFQTDFPLSTVVLWLEWLAWEKNPAGYHVVNILLHSLNAVLIWQLLRRLWIPGAGLAAALFAAHPLCVPSVAWISELKNTLSLPFYLLSLWWYLDTEKKPASNTPPAPDPAPRSTPHASRLPYVLSLAAFLLALLAKTSTVMLPIVLLSLAWWRRGRITGWDLRRAAPYFVLAFAFGLLSVWFQSHQVLHGRSAQNENFFGRIAAAAWAIWFYLGKALVPIKLNLIYPRWVIAATAIRSWVPLLLLCIAFGVLWRARRGWGRPALFGLGFFVVNLFSALGFFDMYFLEISRVSDHFAYISLIGIVGMVAGGLAWIAERFSEKRHGTGAVQNVGMPSTSPVQLGLQFASCGLVVLLAFATFNRARVFATEEGLWRDTLAKNPSAWPALNNLACLEAERQNLTHAITLFESSLALNPNNAAAHINLGRALAQRGRLADAEAHFQSALKLKPNSFEAHRFYASLLVSQRRTGEALNHFQEALKLEPNIDARLEFALALNRSGEAARAIQEFHRVLAAKPDTLEALNNLAWILATSADGKLRDGVEAVRLGEHACRLTDYKQAIPVGTLAAAYAEAGRFPEAQTTAEKAISLATAAGDSRFAQINTQLLALYRSGRAYHQAKQQ